MIAMRPMHAATTKVSHAYPIRLLTFGLAVKYAMKRLSAAPKNVVAKPRQIWNGSDSSDKSSISAGDKETISISRD